jgi:hypothetical protein
MKIKLKKCEFFAQELEFLGHIIKQGTIRPSRRKVEALYRYNELTTVKQLLGFLGLSKFYRKFIQHFVKIAHARMRQQQPQQQPQAKRIHRRMSSSLQHATRVPYRREKSSFATRLKQNVQTHHQPLNTR